MNKRLNANEEFKARKADINRLLLHVCCAPCLASALSKLKNIDVTCFYYNPNIMPKMEWHRRLDAVKTLIDAINAGKFGKEYRKFDLVVVDNGDTAFFDAINGDELLGEHTQRCTKCIGLRLKKTAEWKKKNGFSYFATTLTSSAQKNSELIKRLNQLDSDIDLFENAVDVFNGHVYFVVRVKDNDVTATGYRIYYLSEDTYFVDPIRLKINRVTYDDIKSRKFIPTTKSPKIRLKDNPDISKTELDRAKMLIKKKKEKSSK